MTIRGPAFVDCYDDLADGLTDEMLAAVPGVEVFRSRPSDEEELITRMQGRRHVLVYMGYMSERVLSACPDLKSIAYLATGLATHGDLDLAKHLGIRFEGIKGYGDRAVAEHAITLALSGLKRINEMDREVRAGRFRLMATEEFADKTFGVIGLGGIGAETARIADALGARVIGWTRSGDAGDAPVKMMPLAHVLAQADILSLHLALNDQTVRFIDAEMFARMKRGVLLINTARAAIIDEPSLLWALKDGTISHAGLDVFQEEPLRVDHPLVSMTNVTLTPHSAWLTRQATSRLLVAGFHLLARHVEIG